MTDAPAAAGTPLIQDETDRTALVVSNQRAYRIPLDVANELSACRAELAAAEKWKTDHFESTVQTQTRLLRHAADESEIKFKELSGQYTLCHDALKNAETAKEQSERLLAAVWDNCTVIYWPKDGSYPLEHVMAAGKDSRLLILAALAGKKSPK